jgi:hypothetical protein
MLEWKQRRFSSNKRFKTTAGAIRGRRRSVMTAERASAIVQQPPNSCMNRSVIAILGSLLVVSALGCSTSTSTVEMENPSTPVSTSTGVAAAVTWFPVTSTATQMEHPTLPATPDPKPDLGGLLLRDDFSSASSWNTAVADQASVALTPDGLTIAAQPGVAPVASFRQGFVFSDVYAEVTARPSLCRSGDSYGLLFRAPNNVAYYRFALQCDGTAAADRVNLGSPRVLQPPTLSADAPVGVPGSVRLGVWALGHEFRFFLNDKYQFSATDESYSVGGLGVFAAAGGDTPVTVTFSDLAVYSVGTGGATPVSTP